MVMSAMHIQKQGSLLKMLNVLIYPNLGRLVIIKTETSRFSLDLIIEEKKIIRRIISQKTKIIIIEEKTIRVRTNQIKKRIA
jgi:hypothetical protein